MASIFAERNGVAMDNGNCDLREVVEKYNTKNGYVE